MRVRLTLGEIKSQIQKWQFILLWNKWSILMLSSLSFASLRSHSHFPFVIWNDSLRDSTHFSVCWSLPPTSSVWEVPVHETMQISANKECSLSQCCDPVSMLVKVITIFCGVALLKEPYNLLPPLMIFCFFKYSPLPQMHSDNFWRRILVLIASPMSLPYPVTLLTLYIIAGLTKDREDNDTWM